MSVMRSYESFKMATRKVFGYASAWLGRIPRYILHRLYLIALVASVGVFLANSGNLTNRAAENEWRFDRKSFRVTNNTCYVSMRVDHKYYGLGHQLHGRLTVAAYAEIFKDDGFRFVYDDFGHSIHFEKNDFDYKVLEQFFGLNEVFPTQADFEAQGYKPRWERRRAYNLKLPNSTHLCVPEIIHWENNAWLLLFVKSALLEEYQWVVAHSPTFHRIRRAYFSRPKPKLYFRPGRRNVVVHVRRGDTVNEKNNGKVYPSDFHIRGMRFYIQYFRELGDKDHPYFIIDSDEPEWEGVKALLDFAGPNNAEIGRETNDMLTSFHRFVMADGIVTPQSSFSVSATIYRNNQFPIVACEPGDKNNPWGPYRRVPYSWVKFVC